MTLTEGYGLHSGVWMPTTTLVAFLECQMGLELATRALPDQLQVLDYEKEKEKKHAVNSRFIGKAFGEIKRKLAHVCSDSPRCI